MANSDFFFELPKFDFSLRRSLNAPKKIYLIDTAFHQVAGFNFSPNTGKNLENAVFIDLRRRKKDIYYFAGKSECDFIVKDGSHITQALQVCFSLNKENREREVSGLLEALHKFKLREGQIIALDQEEEFEQESKKILAIPVWKWLLKKSI